MSVSRTLHALQSLQWADPDRPETDGLYLRDAEGVRIDAAARTLALRRDGRLRLMSYFNAFHVTRWRQINPDVVPVLQLKGRGRVRLCWERLDATGTLQALTEVEQRLDPDHWCSIAMPLAAGDGFLAPVVIGLDDDNVLTDGRYATAVAPLRPVRLGLVITHFRRQPQVQGAIARLSALMREPELQGKLTLKVIDNSQDLPPSSLPGVQIVPNRNLGGSGGFARGLFEYDAQGHHTHCLFMDDDASCPSEAVRRSLAVLEWATDDRTAVAGAMLCEERPSTLHENGATFRGACGSLHRGFDVGRLADLARTDALPEIDYGAWWFFAFPIRHVRHYPFPFFVRGDDISFGLANRFRILTLNGVCSWQDSFEEKASPLTAYLDTRNHLVHLLTGHVRDGRRQVSRVLRSFVTRRAEAMLYESAEAALLAVDDVLQGPAFWRAHLDLTERRQRIAELTRIERPRPLAAHEIARAAPRAAPRRLWLRAACHLTLQGRLLPQSLFRGQPTLLRKGAPPDRYATFGYREAIHLSRDGVHGFITHHDPVRRSRIARRLRQVRRELLARFAALEASYRVGYAELASREHWQSVYA